MISEKALKEFKQIWKDEYGEDISNEKAVDLGINLLVMFNNIYRPIKKEWLDEFDKNK